MGAVYCIYCGSLCHWVIQFSRRWFEETTGQPYVYIQQRLECPKVTWFSRLFRFHDHPQMPSILGDTTYYTRGERTNERATTSDKVL